MIYTLEIIAFFQGLFLLIVILRSYHKYKKTSVWLLIGGILSIVLMMLSEKSSALYQSPSDWHLFDSSFFVTFFVLFLKYSDPRRDSFHWKDSFFFIPNIIYFSVEFLEMEFGEAFWPLEILEMIAETIFFGYLVYSFFLVRKGQTQKWFVYFLVPLVGLTALSFLMEVYEWLVNEDLFIPENSILETPFVIFVVLFFYTISFKMITDPNSVLFIKNVPKYRQSGLSEDRVPGYYSRMLEYMEQEKPYLDQDFSVSKMAEALQVPKQYISEILSVHYQTNFQDFVGHYRVTAFLDLLTSGKGDQFTLFGTAQQVGFKSKSTFNTTFKKIKGSTPREFLSTIPSKNDL